MKVNAQTFFNFCAGHMPLMRQLAELAGTFAERLDARIPGHKDLAALTGQRVIRPNDREFYPDRKSLEWREARLNTRN